MTISTDPDILFIFNDSSGTTVSNENTGNSSGTITVASGGTPQYTWNQDAGSYDGYLDIQDATTTDMTHVTPGETFASTLASESTAMRFNISGYDTSNASEGNLQGVGASAPGGAIRMLIQDPTTVGGSPNDFDLQIWCKNIAGFGPDNLSEGIFQDLSFNTDYAIAVSVDRSTPTACVVRMKLDALTEYNPANSNQDSSTLDTVAPSIGRAHGGFDNYYGILARLYYYAYWRGYAISSADLALCNSAPKTTIPLWPSSGSVAPLVGRHLQNMMSN